MIAALTRHLTGMSTDSPAGRRLLLTKEFLDFVQDEMTALTVRWEKRRADIVGTL
jgi:hypothetical protein